MSARFQQLDGEASLNTVLDRARDELVILFNHDPCCPISRRAFTQMEQLDCDVLLVDVSSERELTSEIQSRTGIRHESPQVIVLRDGAVAWSASHFAITAEAVRNVTSANGYEDI